MKNRKAKYLLRHWLRYDKEIQYLEPMEQRNMKLLYTSLKSLNQEERKLLAEKYRVENGPIIDAELADKHRVSPKEYRDVRQKYETKLQNNIDQAEGKYHIPVSSGHIEDDDIRMPAYEIDKIISETVSQLNGLDFTQTDMDEITNTAYQEVLRRVKSQNR